MLQCEMFFPRADVLERHASRVHSIKKMSQKSIACVFCETALPRLEDFYDHANIEHVQVIFRAFNPVGFERKS